MRVLSTVLILVGFPGSTALNSEGTTDCSPAVGEDCELRVEKLYEPERFPGALILPSFERLFGPAEERRRPGNESGLCALGFEPSPLMYDKLAEIEADYQKRGYFVHFYRIAVAGSDGVAEFDVDRVEGGPFNNWGARLVLPQVASQRGGSALNEKVNVSTVDFSAFLEELAGYGGTVPFMKMDIEGAEWEALPFMLEKNQLCDDFIQEAFVETHTWGNIDHWQDERTYDTLLERIKQQECNHDFTDMSYIDDETYYDGEHYDRLGILNDVNMLVPNDVRGT